jgi:hypothetical protein
MKNSKRVFVAALSFVSVVLSGCASKAPAPEAKPSVEVPAETSSEPSIDVWAIRRALKLDRQPSELGYKEASFNTCEMGYGYSSSNMCQRHTMAVIHTRIRCRDSEGTVSQAVGEANLQPVTGQIRWTIGNQSGITTADGEGYTQIVSIFPKSPANTRIKIAAGNQFLYLMHASEAGRLVVPKQWCEK